MTLKLLAPAAAPGDDRCPHALTRLERLRSENQGGGPVTLVALRVCRDCSWSWIERKRRAV